MARDSRLNSIKGKNITREIANETAFRPAYEAGSRQKARLVVVQEKDE
jgi:hypothetical protein